MKKLSCFFLIALFFVLTLMVKDAAGIIKDEGSFKGGILSYGEYGRPAILDPITSNDMISLRITGLLFNGLVGINERQEIVPELADRWEISEDGRNYTFYLRRDVTWHAREEEELRQFTADDVILPTKTSWARH